MVTLFFRNSVPALRVLLVIAGFLRSADAFGTAGSFVLPTDSIRAVPARLSSRWVKAEAVVPHENGQSRRAALKGHSLGRRLFLQQAWSIPVGTVLLHGGSASAEPEQPKLEDYKLIQIFKEAKALGDVRFLAVNPKGAVLESPMRFDFNYVGPFEIPGRGMYMTLAGPDDKEHLVARFECTINLDNCEYMTFDELYTTNTGQLYSMRVRDKDDEVILSILLNFDIKGNGGNKGKYYPGQVEAWKELKRKYADQGGRVKLR